MFEEIEKIFGIESIEEVASANKVSLRQLEAYGKGLRKHIEREQRLGRNPIGAIAELERCREKYRKLNHNI